MQVNEKANDVAQLLNDDGVAKKVAFDPASILMIIELIMSVIKMIQGCKKTPKQALIVYHKPGLMQQAKLRKMVREKAKLSILDPHVDSIVTAMITVGKGVTIEDVQTQTGEVDEE